MENKKRSNFFSGKSILLLVLGTVAFVATEARHALVPRSYYYNRRPRQRALSIMGDIFSMPVYYNSLLRQQYNDLLQFPSQSTSSDHSLFFTTHNTDKNFEVTMDIPGVEVEDLSIELEEGGTIRISGSRKYHTTSNDGSTVVSEANFGKLIHLDPTIVDLTNLSATLSSGILKITAPKKEKSIRKIPIVSSKAKPVIDVEKQITRESEEIHNQETVTTDKDEKAGEEVDGLTITEEDN